MIRVTEGEPVVIATDPEGKPCGTLTVAPCGFHAGRYRWSITLAVLTGADGETGWSELTEDGAAGIGEPEFPIGDSCDAPGIFRSACSFLAAFLESREYTRRTGRAGDNGAMFPDEWADALDSIGVDSDTLAMLAEDIGADEVSS